MFYWKIVFGLIGLVVSIASNISETTINKTNLRSSSIDKFSSDKQSDSWTVMVYIVGSDLQTNHNAGTADITEMLAAGNGDHVNVVVCTGGSKAEGWQTVQYTNLNDPSRTQDLGQLDMAEPATLGNFVLQSMYDNPADKYALILWNHGSGIGGYGNDELSKNSFTIPELAETLEGIYQQTNIKYEVLGFDACLMATLEVASSVSKYANYMVASEELEAASGWNYTPILQALISGYATDGYELGQVIADGFLQQCKSYGFSGNTLSVVDLEAVNDVVVALEELVLDPMLDNYEGLSAMAKSRSQAEAYGKEAKNPTASYDGVDLLDFARNIRKQKNELSEEANEVIKAVRRAVVYNVHDETKPNASGLSIFFPYDKLASNDVVDAAMDSYEKLGFSEVYTQFLNEFVGRAVADEEGPELPEDQVLQEEDLLMAFCNSDDIDEVYVVLIDATDALDGEVEILGVMLPDLLESNEEGGINIGHEWDGTWIGINDYPAYISDISVEGYIDEETGIEEELVIITIPAVLNDNDVILTYAIDAEGSYELISIIPEVEEDGIYKREQIKIKRGDYISLLYEGYDINTDEQFWSEGDIMTLDSEDDLELTISELDPGTYMMGFLLTDYSRNETFVLGEEPYAVD
ncbi:MAG: hypothetical protein ACI9FN_001163 [Saprospiraceae bacterium]|jgi:hypothetical protein